MTRVARTKTENKIDEVSKILEKNFYVYRDIDLHSYFSDDRDDFDSLNQLFKRLNAKKV
jgi:hypothetical protein